MKKVNDKTNSITEKNTNSMVYPRRKSEAACINKYNAPRSDNAPPRMQTIKLVFNNLLLDIIVILLPPYHGIVISVS